MNCPVPGCNVRVQTIKLLARHLNTSVRRNRCGAYMRSVFFICPCGDVCRFVAEIRVHAQIHRSVQLHEVDAPEIDGAYGIEVLPDSPVADAELFLLGIEETESNIVTDPDFDNGQTLYCFSDIEVELLDSDDTDGESDGCKEGPSLWNVGQQSTFSYANFLSHLMCTPTTEIIMEVYRYCINVKITHRCYKQLLRLTCMRGYGALPPSLSQLQKEVESLIILHAGWPHERIASIKCPSGRVFLTPFLSVSDALSIWLTVPIILEAVIASNTKYLPSDLLDDFQYDALIQKRESRLEAGCHYYERVEDGSEYLTNFRKGIPLFREAYLKARNEGILIIALTFGLYEDAFCKSLNSLVGQTVFTMSLRE